jgi:hypothetical protein
MLDLPFALIRATDAMKRQFEPDPLDKVTRDAAPVPPHDSVARRARRSLAGALERASHVVAPG